MPAIQNGSEFIASGDDLTLNGVYGIIYGHLGVWSKDPLSLVHILPKVCAQYFLYTTVIQL